jgi:hypothetical protein
MRVTVYRSKVIIPGFDTVLVGEVYEHALAVLLHHLICSPLLIRECSYGDSFGGSDKGYCWTYSIDESVEVFCFLAILSSSKLDDSVIFLVFECRNSLFKIFYFLRISACCSFKILSLFLQILLRSNNRCGMSERLGISQLLR